MRTWFVYILYSATWDRYYVGVTDEVRRRFREHNAGHSPSTKGGEPWQLVHIEEFASITEAYRRERSIKEKKSRKIIEKIVASPDVRLGRNRDPDREAHRDSTGRAPDS